MAMNAIIQEKRRLLGLTQEQVAEHMGVSVPAVSKWETGQNCPDITLLPKLARLLKMDLNTLFDFHETLSAEEIKGICDAVIKCGQTEGIAPAFELAQQNLREFPHCEALLHNITFCIDGLLNMSPLSLETLSDYETWVLEAYAKLADSPDSQIRNSANYMLASKFIRQGDYDRAQSVLNRMPDKNEASRDIADKLFLQVQVCQQQGRTTEAATALQTALYSAVTRVQLLLGQLAGLEKSSGAMETAEKITEKSDSFAQLFELWDYYACVNQFQRAVSAQNIAEALSLARRLLQAVCHPWEPKDTLLFRHIVWKPAANQTEQLLAVLLASLEQEPEFAFLQKEPAFLQLLAEYRS